MSERGLARSRATASSEHAKGPEAPTVAQSAVVELAMGGIGLVIILVTGRSLAEAYTAPVAPPVAAAVGLLVGIALGGLFGLGVTRPRFAERVRPFLARFTSSAPTVANVALIGLAAALGEETLFRAAIQPVAGIVVASLLFTAAHAAIADFRHPTPSKLAYAALALAMGMVLGGLFAQLGIVASMSAHFAFDKTALLLVRPLLVGAAGAQR